MKKLKALFIFKFFIFQLTKEAYKNNCFGEFAIFRWHIAFKKVHLSAELLLNLAYQEVL